MFVLEKNFGLNFLLILTPRRNKMNIFMKKLEEMNEEDKDPFSDPDSDDEVTGDDDEY